jgi:hypothetical protein
VSDVTTITCQFQMRTPSPVEGKWVYESIFGPSAGSGYMPVSAPPRVGDLVGWGMAYGRVVAVRWNYPSFGSQAWRAEMPDTIGVDVILEPAEELYADEWYEPDEDEDSEDD